MINNMASGGKVGDIFCAAGSEFNKLSELVVNLHPSADSPSGGRSSSKKKSFEDVSPPMRHQMTPMVPHSKGGSLMKSSEVTLNMLNAHHESEVDVEGMHQDFGAVHHEEVTS